MSSSVCIPAKAAEVDVAPGWGGKILIKKATAPSGVVIKREVMISISEGDCDDYAGSQSPKNPMEEEKRMRRVIANSNERRRMQSINNGFNSLRNLLPHQEGEKLSKAAILQLAVQYIYQLEQEKTSLLTRNCELKRCLDQVQCREPQSHPAGATAPASVDGSASSSGAPSPPVVTATAAVHATTSVGAVSPGGSSGQQPTSQTVKREYMNQMHLPPLKRKRAYALAEAEASEAEEGEKRARNANNNAVTHHYHQQQQQQQHHQQEQQHYEQEMPDGGMERGYNNEQQQVQVEVQQHDVKPMKHVIMGVRPMSPSPPISVSVAAQQPVYVHQQQQHGSDGLQQQVMALQRELDQERGYRIALEDKTRNLEAKVHSNGPVSNRQQQQQQTSYHHQQQQQQQQEPQQRLTAHPQPTPTGREQPCATQTQTHHVVGGVEVAPIVEGNQIAYPRFRFAAANGGGASIPRATATYRLAKNENGEQVLLLVEDAHVTQNSAPATIAIEREPRHTMVHQHHQQQPVIRHQTHQSQQQQSHMVHSEGTTVVQLGLSSSGSVQMQDASSGPEEALPTLNTGSASNTKLPPVNLAFASRIGKGVSLNPMSTVVSLRGAQVSVAPAVMSPSQHHVQQQQQQSQQMAPPELRLQEPHVSLSVAQTMTTSEENVYMPSSHDHKSFGGPQKSLETIVEAIRHLEGDQMFESMAQPQQHQQQPSSHMIPAPSPSPSAGNNSSLHVTSGDPMASAAPTYRPRHHHVPVEDSGMGRRHHRDVDDDDEQPLALTVDTPVSSTGAQLCHSSGTTRSIPHPVSQSHHRGGLIMVKAGFKDASNSSHS